MQTSIPNVYAGGDVAGERATVAWAARSGRNAAKGRCHCRETHSSRR